MSAAQDIKPLVIAFACEPAFGSEPGVGWHLVQSLARTRDVWAITHPQHRKGIEAHCAKEPNDRIHIVYHSLPRFLNFALYWSPLLNLYYYFWQIGAGKLARRMHREHHFSIAHHATYVRYWMPTAAAAIGIPFVWWCGGGESTPRSFNRGLGIRGRVIEVSREIVRWIFERDPLVKSAARRCSLGLAVSEESACRMRRLGFANVKVMPAIGHVESDADLRDHTIQRNDKVLRFISMGRLLHWKGFHLGLRAYAKANLPNSEYVIVGDGPDRKRLQRLARRLGIAERARFTLSMPRQWALAQMQMSDVLVFPSLHDSGGFVVLEAMDLKMPVICLDLGGPAVHVDASNGFKIPATSIEQAIDDIAAAMTKLAGDRELRARLGEAGRRRAVEEFSWLTKAQRIDAEYARILRREDVVEPAGVCEPEPKVMLMQHGRVIG